MSVEDKFLEVEHTITDRISRIGKGKYARILKMARKPTRDEYGKSAIITGVGIIIIGSVGFIIYLLMNVFFAVP